MNGPMFVPTSDMSSDVQQPRASGPAERILAALTAVTLMVATLLTLGVIPAAALGVLGIGYAASAAR
jgi:hypothetical protein